MTLDLNNPGTQEPSKSRRKHWRILGFAVLVLILIAAAGLMYVSSDNFRERMRQGAIATLQQATGGRSELKSLEWSLSHRSVTLTDLTVHGREDEKDVPFMHVDKVTAKIKIVSFFSRDFSLEQVVIDHPTVHIIVYPDGTTNQPQSSQKSQTAGEPVQQMFQLAISHAEVTNGIVIFNEQKIPIEIRADDVVAKLAYDKLQKRFDGKFASANIKVKSPTIKTIAGSVNTEFSLYSDHAQIHSLKLGTRRSHLDSVGIISSFQPFKGQFEYKGQFDVAEFASTMTVPELRGGTAEVNGAALLVGGQTSVRGKLALRDGIYQDPNVRLRGVNGGADYIYSSETSRLSLPHIFLHGLGGNAVGTAQIDSFLGEASKQNSAPQRGKGSFQVTSISAHDLVAAVSSRTLPLDTLHAAGTISGKVDISWTG